MRRLTPDRWRSARGGLLSRRQLQSKYEPHADFGFFGPESVTWKVWSYPTSFVLGFVRAATIQQIHRRSARATFADDGPRPPQTQRRRMMTRNREPEATDQNTKPGSWFGPTRNSHQHAKRAARRLSSLSGPVQEGGEGRQPSFKPAISTQGARNSSKPSFENKFGE